MRQYFQTTIINVNVCFDLIGWHAVRMHWDASQLQLAVNAMELWSIAFELKPTINKLHINRVVE